MINFLNNFTWLIFAHCFGDVVFQLGMPSKIKIRWMIAHCLCWTACIAVALQYLHTYHFYKVLFLFAGHYSIDYIKTNIIQTKTNTVEIIDQTLHFIQLIIVYFWKI